MTEYRLFKQSAYHRAVGFYDTFGISVFVDGELTRIVRDISADREKVEAFPKRRFCGMIPSKGGGGCAVRSVSQRMPYRAN